MKFMKYISILTVILLFISCGKENKIDDGEISACTEVVYDENFTIKLGDKVCFPDGQSFTLKTITPEFCPYLVVCDLGGSFKLILETTDIDGDKDLVNLFVIKRLNHQLLFNGYDISNISAELNDPNVVECDNDKIDIEKVTITMSVSAI